MLLFFEVILPSPPSHCYMCSCSWKSFGLCYIPQSRSQSHCPRVSSQTGRNTVRGRGPTGADMATVTIVFRGIKVATTPGTTASSVQNSRRPAAITGYIRGCTKGGAEIPGAGWVSRLLVEVSSLTTTFLRSTAARTCNMGMVA